MSATITAKPTYLYPGKVRDWIRERVNTDRSLSKKVNSNKWVDVSWTYHHLSDEVLDHFGAFLCSEIAVKHFDRLVLDYLDGHRIYIVPTHEEGCEWPLYDPEKFTEGEFYID